MATRQAKRRGWRISILALTCLTVSLPVLGQEQKVPAATDLRSHGVTQDQIESFSETLRQFQNQHNNLMH